MGYSTRRFILCLTLCHFVLVFFSSLSNAITSLGEERAYLSVFCTFVRFVLVWFCPFPLPLGVWEGLRFVIEAFPGHFSYSFCSLISMSLLNSQQNVNHFDCCYQQLQQRRIAIMTSKRTK